MTLKHSLAFYPISEGFTALSLAQTQHFYAVFPYPFIF